MTSVRAVYENGVFRPTEPVALSDGQAVHLTVAEALPPLPDEPLSPEMAAQEGRLDAAKQLPEMHDAMLSAPHDDDDPEFIARLNAATTIQELLAVLMTAPTDTDPEYDELLKDIEARRTRVRFREPELTDDYDDPEGEE